MKAESQTKKQIESEAASDKAPSTVIQGDLDDFIFQDEVIKYHSER